MNEPTEIAAEAAIEKLAEETWESVYAAADVIEWNGSTEECVIIIKKAFQSAIEKATAPLESIIQRIEWTTGDKFPRAAHASKQGSVRPMIFDPEHYSEDREQQLLEQLSGQLAEDLAHDADFHNIDASKWYKVVKKARKFLSKRPTPATASEECGKCEV